MRKIFSITALLIGLAAVGHSEDLIGYWDLNNSFTRSAGTSGNLSASLIDVGPGFINFAEPGSTENLEPGFTAGTALVFGSFATIVGVGGITIENIDLTGYKLPTLSFAGAKDPNIVLFSSFKVEYRIGHSGNWTTVANLPELPDNFETISVPITDVALENQINVELRIRFSEVVDVVSYAQFDNIKITAEAVPEPSTWALIVLGLASVLYFRQFRAVR